MPHLVLGQLQLKTADLVLKLADGRLLTTQRGRGLLKLLCQRLHRGLRLALIVRAGLTQLPQLILCLLGKLAEVCHVYSLCLNSLDKEGVESQYG